MGEKAKKQAQMSTHPPKKFKTYGRLYTYNTLGPLMGDGGSVFRLGSGVGQTWVNHHHHQQTDRRAEWGRSRVLLLGSWVVELRSSKQHKLVPGRVEAEGRRWRLLLVSLSAFHQTRPDPHSHQRKQEAPPIRQGFLSGLSRALWGDLLGYLGVMPQPSPVSRLRQP